jgi:membrane dipeptidase
VASDLQVIEAKLQAIKDIAAAKLTRAQLAYSADDVARIAAAGRIAIIMGLTGAHALGTDLGAIERVYRQGVRMLGLVHMGNNQFVDSSRPYGNEPANEHGGLSSLGRLAIGEANRLGLLIDVSQFSTDAVMQTLRISRAPVVASHSGVRALVDHPRNLTDAEITAIAKAGGVIGIVAFSLYLRNPTQAELAARAAITERYGGMKNGYEGVSVESRQAFYRDLAAVTSRATLEDYLHTIDHVVERVGIDHVALSSDFNQGGGIDGWSDGSEAPNLIAALRKHGYSESDVQRICGRNFLRVWRTAQDA